MQAKPNDSEPMNFLERNEGTGYVSKSRLPVIVEQYQKRIRNIENLEHRIENRAIKVRRRICSVLDQVSTTRPSHLRLFISHSYQPPEIINPSQSLSQIATSSETVIASSDTGSQYIAIPEATTYQKRVLPKPALWTINVEGKLLIDHLDHMSAVDFDKRTCYVAPTDDIDRSRGEKEEERYETTPILFTRYFDKVKVTFQATFYQPQKMNSVAAISPPPKKKGSPKKKSSRRSAVSQQSDDSDSMALGDRISGGENIIDPRSLHTSSKQVLTWTKEMPINDALADSGNNINTNDLNNSSASVRTNMDSPFICDNNHITVNDAHALRIQYEEPQPPALSAAGSGGLTVYSIIATIELYRRKNFSNFPTDTNASSGNIHNTNAALDEYRIKSQKLAEAMFPQYGPETTDVLTGKKRKLDDALILASENENDDNAKNISITSRNQGLPLDLTNEIHVPPTLSMKEIALAFFIYIRDRKLLDEHDKSVVVADELLQDLLHLEHFPFSELQQILLERKLIERVTDTYQPIYIKYIMEKDKAYPFGEKILESQNNNTPKPTLLQLDVDCNVPLLFPARARELLRRIKRRELEYTSSRTKARYLLQPSLRAGGGSGGGASGSGITGSATASSGANRYVAGNINVSNVNSNTSKDDEGEIIRCKIEQAVTHQSSSEDLVPVFLALGKAAPPHTEARTSAHLDARISYLLGRVEERYRAAVNAWDVVDWLCQASKSKED